MISKLISNTYEFIPLNINFIGVEYYDSTIIAYGSHGSMLISYNDGKNWFASRAFEKGDVIQIIHEDNILTAFSNYGEISKSSDNGMTWQKNAEFKDSLLAIIKIPQGYVFRTDKRYFTTDFDFNQKNEYIKSSDYQGVNKDITYKYSLTYLHNCIYAQTGSNIIIKFDASLKAIDSIKFDDYNLCDNKPCHLNYNLNTDGENLFVVTQNYIYIIDKDKTIEKFASRDGTRLNFKIINNTKYGIGYSDANDYRSLKIKEFIDSNYIITKNKSYEGILVSSYLSDFTYYNGKFVFVGDMKYLSIYDSSNDSLFKISDYGFNSYISPNLINDSTMLFLLGFSYNLFYQYIHISNDYGVTMNSNIDFANNKTIKKYDNIYYQYYDTASKEIYLIGGLGGFYFKKAVLFYSNDLGKNFQTKELSNIKPHNSSFLIHRFLPIMTKSGSNFIIPNTFAAQISETEMSWVYQIFTYDKDFNQISVIRDTNKILDFAISRDTNTYLISTIDLSDTSRTIRFTSNRGLRWDTLRLFEKSEIVTYYKMLIIDGKEILAICKYNSVDSLVTFEFLDVLSRTIAPIYSFKIKNPENYDELDKNAIDYSNGKFHLSVYDTLFIFTDRYNPTSWKKHILPNNGNIIRTIKDFGDKYFVSYKGLKDSQNGYWLRIIPAPDTIKPIISVSDIDFGKVDINRLEAVKSQFRILNSSNSKLEIKGISKLNDDSFSISSSMIDSLNPIVIDANSYFEVVVGFLPKSVSFYDDSLQILSNAVSFDNISYLKGEGVDSLVSVKENEIEIENYLFAYPPFPVPASKQIKALIYWDIGNRLSKENVRIYSIYGEELKQDVRLSIDYINDYSGYLIWDCGEVNSGSYLIHIRNGTKTAILKIIIN